MVADSLFSASHFAGHAQQGQSAESLAFLSLPCMLEIAIASMPLATLWSLNVGAYLVHAIAFYFLLCYRPFGIQFHVETSLFSVYFSKLDKGTVKPVRWDVPDDHLDQVKSFGVKTFEDFTWKHILDFYSCADCGRCADNCPSNTVGRPLALRPALANLEIRAASSGAPEVFLHGQPADAAISLSHRAGTAMCTVGAPGSNFGCDLEMAEAHSADCADDYFTADEQVLIADTPLPERALLLALLWSAEESALKALRVGLRLDTRCISVKPSRVTHPLSAGPTAWYPLNIRYSSTQTFSGWWRVETDLVRTVVSDAPLRAPLSARETIFAGGMPRQQTA